MDYEDSISDCKIDVAYGPTCSSSDCPVYEYSNFVISLTDLMKQQKLPNNTLELAVADMHEKGKSTTLISHALLGK